MLISLIRSGASPRDILIQLLLTLPIILMSLTLHECAHGWVAMKCGDRTASNLGRLSINPIKHLDPIGFLCMLLFGFGWAKPVPINSRNFRKPRRDIALTAAAGPCMNLAVSFVMVLVQAIFVRIVGIEKIAEVTWMYVLYLFLYLFVEMNAFLAIFNLIPIPPFDGSRIIHVFMPAKWYFKLQKSERVIQIIILILFWVDPFGIFSGCLTWLTNNVINLMYRLIYLIPFLR